MRSRVRIATWHRFRAKQNNYASRRNTICFRRTIVFVFASLQRQANKQPQKAAFLSNNNQRIFRATNKTRSSQKHLQEFEAQIVFEAATALCSRARLISITANSILLGVAQQQSQSLLKVQFCVLRALFEKRELTKKH